jgi:phenylacetate-CoA ligase
MDSTPSLRQRIYEMLMESQYWPPEQMLAYQRSQLAQLLRHAKATVPFYKTRLDVVFKKNGGIDWDRWHEIPIVTRADLRDNRDEMLTTALPPGHGPTKTFYSSGSSGVPVSIEATGIATEANLAASYRFFENQRIDTQKPLGSQSKIDADGRPLREDFHAEDWGNSTRKGPSYVVNGNLPELHKLELLRSLGVSYLKEFTNNAEFLATSNLQLKEPVKFDAVICYGQGITQEQGNLFQKSFGARSLSIYSSKESGQLGYQCGDGPHFHLNSEIVLIEILRSDDSVCGPGERGRVIVTPFLSTALPLIRYDQGDTAELFANCTCANKLPVLSGIAGRQDQLLRFPDGMSSAVGLKAGILSENLDALAFQLAQVEFFKLEIRYVPADFSKQINEKPIIAHIHQIIHPKLDVIFKPVEKIPLNLGGKQQRVVCEIAPQS